MSTALATKEAPRPIKNDNDVVNVESSAIICRFIFPENKVLACRYRRSYETSDVFCADHKVEAQHRYTHITVHSGAVRSVNVTATIKRR